MKKYEIEINSEVYHVSVKELDADADMSSEQMPTEPEPVDESVTESEPTESVAQRTTGDGTEVKAPMPGTILKVSVSPGQSISQGDTLVVLEAMKMENEVVAPADGVVDDILVSANDRVESDQLLLTI